MNEDVFMIGLSVYLPCERRSVLVAHIFNLSGRNVVFAYLNVNPNSSFATMFVFRMENMQSCIKRDLVGVFFIVIG